MSSIFLKLESRAQMPVKGDPSKVYQIGDDLFYVWLPEMGGYCELKAEQLADAKLVDQFGQLFDSIKTEIPYNMAWSNGVGGQSGAVLSSPVLRPGDMAVSVTPASRRMVFVGTYYGNVVIYDRFNPNKSVIKNHLVYDAPEELSSIVDLCDPSGKLTQPLMEDFVGIGRENIGMYLKSIYDSIRVSGRWRG